MRGIEQTMSIFTSLTAHYLVYIYGSPFYDCERIALFFPLFLPEFPKYKRMQEACESFGTVFIEFCVFA